MTHLDATLPWFSPKRALIFAGVLFALELVIVGSLFKHGLDFECHTSWPQAACSGANGMLTGIYCASGALLLLFMLRPAPFRALGAETGHRSWPLALNLAGVLIALLPLSFLSNSNAAEALLPTFICWSLGMGAMVLGLALYITPAAGWRLFFVGQWRALVPVLLTGLAAPSLANVLRPVWQLDTISGITFDAVSRIVSGLGYPVEAYPAERIIGAGEFFIDVAPQCSGIEGIALVTLFVTLYLRLFRQDLRFPRALLLYPIGILTSALFNVVRIAVLLIIGLEGSPELAVGGFHSHAGWLMFTLVALGIIALAQTVPWLQKAPAPEAGPTAARAAPLPFRQDWVVATILPFAIFMLSALLAQAFSATPGLVYPGRVILMAGVLALFWPLYARLPWRLDPLALGAGAVIGLYWVLIPAGEADATPPYGALGGAALVVWFILRGIGTTVLVPVIEELFFRDYLEAKLRFGTGALWAVTAAILSATLFAALHGRWLEAFVAGLIFSWVARRRGNITDAIIAHAAANALIYGVALSTGQMHII